MECVPTNLANIIADRMDCLYLMHSIVCYIGVDILCTATEALDRENFENMKVLMRDIELFMRTPKNHKLEDNVWKIHVSDYMKFLKYRLHAFTHRCVRVCVCICTYI